MSNFKGTKGKSSITNNFDVSTDNFGLIATTFRGGSGMFKTITIEQQESNTQLIADAFNIINKCDLFPSQLLEQRNEMLEMLKEVFSYLESDIKAKAEEMLSYKIEQLIKKTTGL